MKEEIIKYLKKMQGSLLGVGIDDPKMLDIIENNDGINLCYLLSSNDRTKNGKKFKMYKKDRTKKVNIKKLSKYFRIKSIDNIVCNYNVIKKYIRAFQGESVYINKGKIYIYGNIDDLNNLKEKYERFSKDVKLIKKNNSFLLIIDNKNAKTNIFKNTFYKISDFLNDTVDILTDLLIN